jgi:hypothetical protein
MALSNDEVQAIAMEVARIVLASAPPPPPCVGACNLKPEHIEGMGHMVGMICDLGKGSFRVGIEAMRENANYTKRQRAIVSTTTMASIILVIGTCITGIITSIWMQIKQ